MEKNLYSTLEAAVIHSFRDVALAKKALSHRSINVDAANTGGDNQRLEFLGDRVLGLVVAHMLYETFPEEAEGVLARRLAALCNRPAIASVARQLNLGDYIILSAAEEASGGRILDSTLEDACEALIGALYLDGGLEAATRFIQHYWQPLLQSETGSDKDAKTALQEWAQGQGWSLPTYEITSREGPDHAPLFTIQVTVGKWTAQGNGSPKKLAEQAAAFALLQLLGEI